ncbi:hypothetical protein N665_0602s0009 [Sinapis alba]|nr:hypothetical protein N665_0602s0009 [Sinapis alba]
MGRMVPIYEGVGFKELEKNVLREFKVDENRFRVSLSNWPPTSFELATGIKTPPVLLTSDGAVRYFCQHLKVKGGMNLFARFEIYIVDTKVVDDSRMEFVSPIKGKGIPWPDNGNGSTKVGYVLPAASKTRVVNLEDDEFVREVEKVEEKIRSESFRGGTSKADEYSGCSFDTMEEEGWSWTR